MFPRNIYSLPFSSNGCSTRVIIILIFLPQKKFLCLRSWTGWGVGFDGIMGIWCLSKEKVQFVLFIMFCDNPFLNHKYCTVMSNDPDFWQTFVRSIYTYENVKKRQSFHSMILWSHHIFCALQSRISHPIKNMVCEQTQEQEFDLSISLVKKALLTQIIFIKIK